MGMLSEMNYISTLTFLLASVGFGRPAMLFPSAVYLCTVSTVHVYLMHSSVGAILLYFLLSNKSTLLQ